MASVDKAPHGEPHGGPVGMPPQSRSSSTTSSIRNNFDLEPNPFEQSFAVKDSSTGPSTATSVAGGDTTAGSSIPDSLSGAQPQTFTTPGGRRHLLPPVASITSPSSLIPNPQTPGTMAWANSLRSGPLSPAMLQGPQAGGTGANGVATSTTTGNGSGTLASFVTNLRRSGITPGGSGTMFPTPGPATAAILGLAPNTTSASTGQVHSATAATAAGLVPTPAVSSEGHGINSLTTVGDGTTAPVGYDPSLNPVSAAATTQPIAISAVNGAAPGLATTQSGPVFVNTTAAEVPLANTSGTAGGLYVLSEASDSTHSSPAESKRSRTNAPNGNKRIKTEPAPLNGSAMSSKSKSSKNSRAGNNGAVSKKNASQVAVPAALSAADDSSNDEAKFDADEPHGRKKHSDEEKRKSFLERNRIAALKCRQRKKQWQANLESKVQVLSSENKSLNDQLARLQGQLTSIRALLYSHRDCPNMPQETLASVLGTAAAQVPANGPPQPYASVPGAHPPGMVPVPGGPQVQPVVVPGSAGDVIPNSVTSSVMVPVIPNTSGLDPLPHSSAAAGVHGAPLVSTAAGPIVTATAPAMGEWQMAAQ